MNRAEAINSLKFKGKTKAIAIKFDYNHYSEATNIAIGYNEVDIKSAGKVKVSIMYDGSVFPAQFEHRIGASIDHYLNQWEGQPASMSGWGLANWFLVPLSAITDEYPFDFWAAIAKEDFTLYIKNLQYSEDTTQTLINLIDSAEVKELTVEQWNEARMSLFNDRTKELYTTR